MCLNYISLPQAASWIQHFPTFSVSAPMMACHHAWPVFQLYGSLDVKFLWVVWVSVWSLHCHQTSIIQDISWEIIPTALKGGCTDPAFVKNRFEIWQGASSKQNLGSFWKIHEVKQCYCSMPLPNKIQTLTQINQNLVMPCHTIQLLNYNVNLSWSLNLH